MFSIERIKPRVFQTNTHQIDVNGDLCSNIERNKKLCHFAPPPCAKETWARKAQRAAFDAGTVSTKVLKAAWARFGVRSSSFVVCDETKSG